MSATLAWCPSGKWRRGAYISRKIFQCSCRFEEYSFEIVENFVNPSPDELAAAERSAIILAYALMPDRLLNSHPGTARRGCVSYADYAGSYNRRGSKWQTTPGDWSEPVAKAMKMLA